MSSKFIGDLKVDKNVIINNQNAIRSLNGVQTSQNGNIDIPIYPRADVDKMLSVLPVSRVGSMDYLPLNINGSFEGSSNNYQYVVYPMIMEQDGTAVYLRPGTNGSTSDFYYCYIKNVRTVTNLQPVLTNTKYIPTTFTSNHKLVSFIASDTRNVLMMKTKNGPTDTYTLALTNGTFNRDAHQSVEFNRSLITGTIPQYAILSGDKIYIVGMDSFSLASEMACSVYSILVSDIKSGISSSLTRLTGFSGANLFSQPVSSSVNIKIAPMHFSTDPLDNSIFCIPTGNVYTSFGFYLSIQDGVLNCETQNDNIRVSINVTSQTNTTQTSLAQYNVFSFVFNTTTKHYTIDNAVQGQSTITTNAQGIITWNNQYSKDPNLYVGTTVNNTQNRVPSYFTTADGLQISAVSRHETLSEHYACRMQNVNFTSAYDAWNVNNRNTTNLRFNSISPVFGSVIGENLIHPTIINANKILMHCAGTDAGSFTSRDTVVYTELSGNPDYVYPSLLTTTKNGFAPNANRGVLDNTGNKYIGCITIIAEDGSTKVYGSSFTETVNKISSMEMNQSTMQIGTQITISPNVLSTLKSEMLAGVTLPYPAMTSLVTLYFVPDNTFTKSYAIAMVKVDAPSGTANSYVVLSEVDVDFSSNNVNFCDVLTSRMFSTGINNTRTVSTNLYERQSGLIIAKYPEFTYVGIPALVSANSTAAQFSSIVCKVDNTTKMIRGTPFKIATAYNASHIGTYEVGAIPGIGFGLFVNGIVTDIQTKLVFKNYGTTEAAFDTMANNQSSAGLGEIVIAAQNVAEDFNIYFTQEVPVFLNGKFFKMPVQSKNLADLYPDPKNKTFYIYVRTLGQIQEYYISDVLMSEDVSRTYIGTITTDSTSITSIVSEKVTRFMNYRVSTTKRGSAIPCSTGVPSSPSTRWS